MVTLLGVRVVFLGMRRVSDMDALVRRNTLRDAANVLEDEMRELMLLPAPPQPLVSALAVAVEELRDTVEALETGKHEESE